MSLTKILTQKDADAEVQLEAVAEVIASARKAYGNEEAVIEAPMVATTNGSMSFIHLEAGSRVEHLRAEVRRVKAAAVEFVEQNPGASMDKRIEELLAINPFFTSVGNGTKFAYL